jgi:hypothetical protein
MVAEVDLAGDGGEELADAAQDFEVSDLGAGAAERSGVVGANGAMETEGNAAGGCAEEGR